MSDMYRRYRAINREIMHFQQPRPTEHREQHFNTLAALICGLLGSSHAHLPAPTTRPAMAQSRKV